MALGCGVVLTASGCAFQGLNSLPLPGAVGAGPDANIYHVEIANVATLESNSPVMMGDVVVGSVGKMTVHNWHADVEVSVKPDVIVPANAVASVGQTSLLGSMHLALNPPIGQQAEGHLAPGVDRPAEPDRRPTRRPRRRWRRCRRSSTAAGWARSATSSTTSAPL